MKLKHFVTIVFTISFFVSCTKSYGEITSSSTGKILTGITARVTGGGSNFDGKVDQKSDLEAIVETAWGEGRLGLHRGHAPFRNVFEAFLGISHDEMHVLMEDFGLNLAGVCQKFGFDPENLVETLTLSVVPHLEEGVANGVITRQDMAIWIDRVRTEFRKRVYWEG